MRHKLTAEEKKERKEHRRIRKIKYSIGLQSVIINFHDLYEIVGDDGSIKRKEVDDANKKILELEKML